MLLPTGSPIKENIDPSKISLPDALEKLRVGLFSGYLRFCNPDRNGVVLFENGRMIGAYYQEERETKRFFELDALGRIFDMSLMGQARMDIYRLSPELVISAHALLRGEILHKGQDLQLIDIKSLMGKVKNDKLDGCLRIYAGNKTSLIFYEEGTPLGFFHDGSAEIETTADASMSVATQVGAKVDIVKTANLEDLPMTDLMAVEDLAPMWQQIQQQVRKRKPVSPEEQAKDAKRREAEKRERLPQMLRSIAEKDLGKLGGSLIDREFSSYSGPMTQEALFDVVKGLGKAATLIAGPQAVDAMKTDMRQAILSLLKS